MDAKDLRIAQLEAAALAHQQRAAQLQQQLTEASVQHQAVIAQYQELLAKRERKIAEQDFDMKRLLKSLRGSRQERINPAQILLFSLEELQQLMAEVKEPESTKTPEEQLVEELAAPGRKKRKPTGRRRLPQDMPREVIRHELSAAECSCPSCGTQRVEFAVESSFQLEHVPASWKAIEHQRVKYKCPCCQEQVVVAPKPPQPIEKGLPGPGLCAFVTLSKFGDHLPLYREEDLFSRTGHLIRRSTICGWLRSLAMLAKPLYHRMKYLVLRSKVIHTDDTKIKMLQPLKCAEAKFWPYLGDWEHPYVVYDFTIDRSRAGPQNFLAGYQGYLQADAYAGYDCVLGPGKAQEVACWIHARRYWHEVQDYDLARANIALGYIARLSQIESELRVRYPADNRQGRRDFTAIAEMRQQLATPILYEFGNWLRELLASRQVLPKSPTAKALGYTMNQWKALCRYVEQGYLSMDNNSAERAVKTPAIGRKNYLFVGSEEAGQNAGIFYTLVGSAKRNGVEPYAWLKEIFQSLPNFRDSEAFQQSREKGLVVSEELDRWLPDQWLEANPKHRWTIDEIRGEERNQKERAKRNRRRKIEKLKKNQA
jgi:transposase